MGRRGGVPSGIEATSFPSNTAEPVPVNDGAGSIRSGGTYSTDFNFTAPGRPAGVAASWHPDLGDTSGDLLLSSWCRALHVEYRSEPDVIVIWHWIKRQHRSHIAMIARAYSAALMMSPSHLSGPLCAEVPSSPNWPFSDAAKVLVGIAAVCVHRRHETSKEVNGSRLSRVLNAPLSDAQALAMTSYTHSEFSYCSQRSARDRLLMHGAINGRVLRKGINRSRNALATPGLDFIAVMLQSALEAVSAAYFQHACGDNDVIDLLFRGDCGASLTSAKVGTMLSTGSFWSTSSCRRQARRFVPATSQGQLIRIRVPRPPRGYVVAPIGFLSIYPQEDEWLLPPGTPFTPGAFSVSYDHNGSAVRTVDASLGRLKTRFELMREAAESAARDVAQQLQFGPPGGSAHLTGMQLSSVGATSVGSQTRDEIMREAESAARDIVQAFRLLMGTRPHVAAGRRDTIDEEREAHRRLTRMHGQSLGAIAVWRRQIY